jgi:hypothetical protein
MTDPIQGVSPKAAGPPRSTGAFLGLKWSVGVRFITHLVRGQRPETRMRLGKDNNKENSILITPYSIPHAACLSHLSLDVVSDILKSNSAAS